MTYTIAFDVPEDNPAPRAHFFAASSTAITFDMDYAVRFEDEGDAERFLAQYGESVRPWGVVVEVDAA